MTTNEQKDHHIKPAIDMPELTYVPLGQTFGNETPIHDSGDPLEYLGIDPDEWQVVKMVFTINPETVIGRLFSLTGNQMELTDTTISRAILLEQRKQDVPTGKFLYLLYADTPEGFGDWTAYPIEQIQKDWPEGVMFPYGSLPDTINNPNNRILAVSVEDLIKSRGGDLNYHIPKPHPVTQITNLSVIKKL